MDTSNQAGPVEVTPDSAPGNAAIAPGAASGNAAVAQTPPAPPGHPSVTHAGSVGEALSNLMSYIPGFAGYKSVEDRRIADKQLRAVIGERLSKIKARLDGLMDAASRGGNLESLPLIDQSGRRLEKIIDRMRFADYGYTAVFDRIQMGEPELERIYTYDTGIMGELGVFDDAVSSCEQSANDLDRLRGSLAKLDALTAEFDRRFDARKHLFDGLPTP